MKAWKLNKQALVGLAALLPFAAEAANVTSIDFKQQTDASEIRITSDGPIQVEKTENSQDKQIVLELRGATLSKGATRKLDTSSFKSKVSLISPYMVAGQGDSRIVVQLRDRSDSQLIQDGNQIILKISDTIGSTAAAPGDADQSELEAVEASAGVAPGSAAAAEPAPPTDVAMSAPSGSTDPLQVFDESKRTRRYIGKPITLQVRDMDLVDVFQLIGEASGFNVIVGDEVKGKITMSLAETPWDQVLDLILQTKQLGAERRNNVLRITTLSNLTSEKGAELAAKRASEATAPRVTRIFPVSYAKLGDLVGTFQKFASVNNTATDGGLSTIVQADERTNSIIVRDTVENLDRLKKLIELLDTQTPQVLIEAKVVEANSQFANKIGGSFGTATRGSTTGTNSNFAGATFNDGVASQLGVSNITGSLGGMKAGLSFGFIPGVERVNALLAIEESESNAKQISSPRVVVLNKETASISAGTPATIKTVVVNNAGSNSADQTVQAQTSLNVTPTVTNDSSVLLQLNVSRDIVNGDGQPAPRNISTKVVVESGLTLVIGGLYTEQSSQIETGVPYLRKIPILGHLFGSKADQNSRTELFIFITPKILNEKESGLVTGSG